MSENRGISGSGGSGAAAQSTGGGTISDATKVVRDVASGASETAGHAYNEGSRYIREASEHLPDVGDYAEVVRGPLARSPLTTAIAVGAIGYLAAYLVHGGGFRSLQGASAGDDGQHLSKRSRRRHRR